jgi:simple sugar transport system permease protein
MKVFFKIIKWREKLSVLNVLASILAVGIGMAILVLSLYMCQINISLGLQTIYAGSLGRYNSISETLLRATILALISYGLIISFTAGVWNIGAEGQYIMGAIASTIVCLTLGNISGYFLIPLAMIISVVIGAAWALIPGLLLVKLNINEVLTTLMMNYIAQYILSWLVTGPLQDKTSMFPESPYIPKQAFLPRIIPIYRLNYVSLILLILLAPLIHIVLGKTWFGLSLKILGSSKRTARYAGINVNRTIIISIVISGALAGLAGALEIMGVQYKLRPGIVQGYGYTGIVITLVGNLHPYGALLASVLMASLINGISETCQLFQIPIGLAQILQGIFLITVISLRFLFRFLIEKYSKVYGE